MIKVRQKTAAEIAADEPHLAKPMRELGFAATLQKVDEALAVEREKTKAKGGRPKTIEGEPWVAEGVSRRTWFRRQKVAKP